MCVLSPAWLFCDPMDCGLPGFSVHGSFQARTLEKWKWKSLSGVWLFVIPWTLQPHGQFMEFSRPQNTGVGSLSLLQGIFLTCESNRGLLHCRQILYQLSYQGSSRTLEWVGISYSRGSSRSRDQTSISCIGRQILYHWAIHTLRLISWKLLVTKNSLWSYLKIYYHRGLLILHQVKASKTWSSWNSWIFWLKELWGVSG